MDFAKLINQKYDDFSKKITSLEGENTVLKNSVRNIEKSFEKLSMSYNDFEQYGRRECVEIKGIPDAIGEATNELVVKVGQLIGVPVKGSDISISHRLPSKSSKAVNCHTIIATFVRRDVKEKFYRARGQLWNKTTKDLGYSINNHIYISESLAEANKNLFHSCLKYKKDNGYKFIWTLNGKIFIRKYMDCNAIQINRKDDLLKLSK